jgi:hypothetical protein
VREAVFDPYVGVETVGVDREHDHVVPMCVEQLGRLLDLPVEGAVDEAHLGQRVPDRRAQVRTAARHGLVPLRLDGEMVDQCQPTISLICSTGAIVV